MDGNRYRSKPVENIKLSNLLLHLDAANANRGTANYAVDTGCSSNLMWDPLQEFGEVKLDSFTSCGTYGWKGDGSSSYPYRLKFDGAASGVWHYDSNSLSFTDGLGNDLPFYIGGLYPICFIRYKSKYYC